MRILAENNLAAILVEPPFNTAFLPSWNLSLCRATFNINLAPFFGGERPWIWWPCFPSSFSSGQCRYVGSSAVHGMVYGIYFLPVYCRHVFQYRAGKNLNGMFIMFYDNLKCFSFWRLILFLSGHTVLSCAYVALCVACLAIPLFSADKQKKPGLPSFPPSYAALAAPVAVTRFGPVPLQKQYKKSSAAPGSGHTAVLSVLALSRAA